MKCFLLAAGKGTRLLPITLDVPKCLVKINNVPLLQYWLELFEIYSIDEVYINLHHLQNKVVDFVNGFNSGIKINLIYEESLLGSLGTLVSNKESFLKEEFILICYADNLTNLNIKDFIDFHKSHNFPISMGLFQTKFPRECGILELNESGTVISFEEKPKHPKTNLANAGVYIINTNLFNEFGNSDTILDIAYHLLPKFINNMKGYLIKEFIFDIGNIEKLIYADNYVKSNLDEFDFCRNKTE